MITLLQHGEHEGPGTIIEHLQEHRHSYEILRLYEDGRIPGDLPDNLIILGGQMSVNDTPDYPYFTSEKKLVAAMIGKNRPVLGICLGAQMIASALGQEVQKNIRETGWHRVHGRKREWYPLFPERVTVFHWHEETFNLPGGATLLAEGDAVKNQAFRIGSAIGVQFHPEVTMEIILSWTKDLPDADRVRIIGESGQYLAENRRRCGALIDAFTRGWEL